ncbi:hypothetical protein C8J56DRAFT_1082201 [Mycena floridula]|nr:hypothetical protein C8J56DRAFT_1082201 [Mycena floridula]
MAGRMDDHAAAIPGEDKRPIPGEDKRPNLGEDKRPNPGEDKRPNPRSVSLQFQPFSHFDSQRLAYDRSSKLFPAQLSAPTSFFTTSSHSSIVIRRSNSSTFTKIQPHNPGILDDTNAPFLQNISPHFLASLEKVTLTSDLWNAALWVQYCYSQFDPVYAALKERDVTLELVFLSGLRMLWELDLRRTGASSRALELGTGIRFYFSPTMMGALVGFLAIWPTLENVVFKPPCVLQDGEQFSREFMKVCRRVRRVEVNGAVYEE